jgi:phosphoribosylformylglycinamidine cyclo-ligase
VSGTDGVGTKLKLAFALGGATDGSRRPGAIERERRARAGAEPLFFLTISPAASWTRRLPCASSAASPKAARQAGCALIGGETAEMPGMYPEGEYDLAGFCVGVSGEGQDH